jgi:hypothetical protein
MPENEKLTPANWMFAPNEDELISEMYTALIGGLEKENGVHALSKVYWPKNLVPTAPFPVIAGLPH